MNHESESSIAQLASLVIAFRDARDWAQFHNPKDVAISLVLEATELLELFQWSPEGSSQSVAIEKRTAVEEEMADILYWLLLLSHDLQLDLAQALRRKLAINNDKYPIGLSRGKATKYNRL